jgi:D-alanyl-D-alanine dipeptidase
VPHQFFFRGKAVLLALALAGTVSAAGNTKLPRGFVYLSDVDPSIIQDMRYAGYDNFMGGPVPGYKAPECILVRSAAKALSRVQEALKKRGLSLKVYDCYRPKRAVRAFVRSAADGKADATLKRFYPNIRRSQLLRLGYVASRSMHSMGATVDLTLVALPEKEAAPFDPVRTYGACTAAFEDRAPDSSVDMGTGFDCFDPRSHTWSRAISPDQREWRQTLRKAMAKQGYTNYSKEWWHYTYGPAAGGARYDFPVTPRGETGSEK